ncbi:MAG: aminotransferase class I/II-fold pyridoxal phosphate-dependent enzyme [Phycisphaerae bacterium]|jgi:LL-diaminopimelate aminotransferase|nr:aminotransferase class I/II-fold pyridoxal phosphate-dependent enzyme [Phycisphaerae bacterium]
MDVKLSERLSQLPPYLFADLRRKIAAARAAGVDVITLGIGDPDYPTPDPIIEELCRAVADESDTNRHRYGCDVPAPEFPAAVLNFYKRRWDVDLGDDQVVCTMGSKDAIAKMGMAIMDPGDIGIIPEPGYPTYNISHVFAGATSYRVPLRPENDWLFDFDEVPAEVADKARILWLNYPNNPTCATASLEFFEKAIAFGRAHNILIAHDSAYSENTYDGYKAPSILQVPGADDVAVEFFSLSKAFNMTGWRVGCVVGNASAVKALSTVKDNIDNGTLRAVQLAAAKALDRAEGVIPPICEVYQRRRDLVVDTLNANGWSIEKPASTIYIWAPVPEVYEGRSGDYAADLLEKVGVVVTPGRGYGETGEGFFRISLTYPDDVLKEALDRMISICK